MINPFRGLGVALITPFTKQGGIDFASLEALVERVVNAGVDFLCVLGTTAETPTLTSAEKQQVMQVVMRVNAGRLPLMLGLGGNDTAKVCETIKSTDLSGFQGVLVVTPYYNKPSQEGLYQHYKAVSAASPLPLVLYNVPGRTGVNMLPETVARIAHDCSNVVAIKEASGNIEQAEEIIKLTEDLDFDVISGDDKLTRAMMQRGGVGVISVIGNAYPEEFKAVVDGQEPSPKLAELVRLSMADGNPGGIKCILHALGYCLNVLRLPLVPVNDVVNLAIISTVKE